MPVSVTMPRLGESVSEGTVTRWLKKEGERVEADEPLLEVSTDKVDTEIPSPAAGVLTQIKVGEDETVDVGVELAVIDQAAVAGGDGSPSPSAPEGETAEVPAADAAPSAPRGPAGYAERAASTGAAAVEPDAARQPSAQPSAQPAAQHRPPVPPKPADEGQHPAVAAASTEPPPPVSEPAGPQVSVQPRSQSPAPAAAAPAAATQAVPVQTSADGHDGDQAAYVTPLVRKLASEHHVDLARVSGTGVGGRIRKQDVLDAAAAEQARQEQAAAAQSAPQTATTHRAVPSPAAAQLRGRTEKLSRLRAVIAQRMVESLQTSAQLTSVIEVDVTKVAKLRQQAKASFEATHGVKLSFLPFFAVATAEALRQHPRLNASLDTGAGAVTYHDVENLGLAVDTDRGLMAPVIRDAGDLNLGGMARKIADLAGRTRNNKVGPDDLVGGTFTLTNTGSRGALFDTPILFQPQVGILGTGAVVKRAVIVDDPELGEVIVPRSMVYLALSYDHRLVDGADAARFLGTIKERLEGGAFEADLGLL
jgi:2-oxoglutarate dehydrogenase E2 component (dihydrolipoamide succinyltransferase)